ncbi:MAG: tripartite tricarboxylate transporter TctB family protein [Alphaproteobacteria bacterium]|nr:tripartite tricarboxylate transporter TctB family protein [Alphaproteobacteria bacterium]
MPRRAKLLLKAVPPALILIAAFVLPRFMLQNQNMAAMIGEGEAGPTFWPNVMLTLVAICSAFWLVREVWTALRAPAVAGESPPPAAPYNWRLAWTGLAIVILYGVAIQYLGFAFATLLFLAVWLILGGVRRPLTVAPVAVIGTLVLLYVFVALAQMPLDRGRGVFAGGTIELYQALRIY